MRPAKMPERQVLERLTKVFREKGYGGASFAELMSSTGLVKASLYHRFPGGKAEIADAVLAQVDREFAERVLRAAGRPGDPRARARALARELRRFYGAGKNWCLLDTLTLSSEPRTLRHARSSMEFWIRSFAQVARAAGLGRGAARQRAEDAVAAVEGGLIVARVTGNRRPFLRALASLPARLTARSPKS